MAAPHLLPHPSGEWAWWKPVLLRGPGFPAAGIGRLRHPAVAALADDEAGAYPAAFEAAVAETTNELAAIARDPSVRAAIAWQNHRALATALDPLLRRHPGSPRRSKDRQHEELVARYWQRYLLKNDTIGFFGPVGWGEVDATRRTSVRPGRNVVARTSVFFEPWAVDRLGLALVEQLELREWVAPRPMPYLRVEDGTVRVPGAAPVPLSAVEAAILECCDGIRSARDLVLELAADAHEVYALLETMAQRRWLRWELELPLGPHPEADLRAFLERVDDDERRMQALAALDEVESARARVEADPRDPDRLRGALTGLDRTFTAVTGASAQRNQGRTLLYHDCRRDVDLVLGSEIVRALEPLDLFVRTSRWFGHEVAQAVEAELLETYWRAVPTAAGLDLATFWFAALEYFHGRARSDVDAVAEEMQRRWTAILGCDLGAREARFAADELRDAVLGAFPAPHAGWSGARYTSPDLLVRARGAEAIARGDFEIVLGELHFGLMAYRLNCFVLQHDDPDALLAATSRDFPEPRLYPVLPKDSPPRLTMRTHNALVRPSDYLVSLLHETADPRRPNLWRSADVAVEERDDRIWLVFPDGAEFPAIELFSELLIELILPRFDLLGGHPHVPRVTIDRLVATREAWRTKAAELAFAFERSEERRFLEARRWRAAHGVPTEVFVKSPLETKPFYVAFDSPIYVEILAKAARKAAESDGATLTLTEMLPTTDELWLTDGEGNAYAAELRLVAFDLRPTDRGDAPALADALTAARSR